MPYESNKLLPSKKQFGCRLSFRLKPCIAFDKGTGRKVYNNESIMNKIECLNFIMKEMNLIESCEKNTDYTPCMQN